MEKTKTKKLTALKIISAIIFIGITVYLIVGLVDAVNGDPEKLKTNLALYLTFVVIIFGTIGNVLALIPAVVGLIYTAIRYQKGQGVSQLITFIVLTILPILSQTFFILFCTIKA